MNKLLVTRKKQKIRKWHPYHVYSRYILGLSLFGGKPLRYARLVQKGNHGCPSLSTIRTYAVTADRTF